MPRSRPILVTGAPRTATTPVGNMLASAQASVSLYEPLGTTGVRSNDLRFPMVGEGLGMSEQELAAVIDLFARRRTGPLHSQQRGKYFSWSRALFGSRTLHSARLARLHPFARNVIWKDPHAIMLAPDVASRGVPTVVTARRPEAHAASYRRLGWVSRAREIYPRWAARFGPCAIAEEALTEADDPVVSAALIWRMSYLGLIRTDTLDKVMLVTSEDLIADEAGTYARLFERLGLAPSKTTRRMLSAQRDGGAAIPDKGTTHDWSRSAASANSYWSEILSDADLAAVRALTGDVVGAIFPD